MLKLRTKIRKRSAIYLPKKLMKELNLKEGDTVEISVSNNGFFIQPISDPIHLALYGKKYASISFEEAERISEEEQHKYEGSP